ncbi:MAG: PEP-CTERM sorting domain-containing protein [Sphingomonadales bacterium]|nr:PEP-CTERM sorting domain-containing protein [Sphingomonadales bacterium]
MKAALFALATLTAAVPATAQTAPAPAQTAPAAAPRTILFIGNSFTQGAHSPVRNYRASTVTDLNGDGLGGVPALFKLFSEQAGLNYAVSLETQGGRSLGFHLTERAARFNRPWDVVVLQEYSTLDRQRPGDATAYIRDSGALAAMFTRANRNVDVYLMPTWSRADLVWKPGSPWSGTPINKMADDLFTAAVRAKAASRDIDGIVPVGLAWNRAFSAGVADPNPYDGIAFGQLDLWSYDQYHASTAGYYLEALTVFGRVTGVDPRTLGGRERAADDLGLSNAQASALQRIAYETLQAEGRR